MFFRKPPFGLDISDYSIEIISLEGRVENPKLLAMGRTILEPGIFEDGKILNKEDLKKNLKNLIENPKFGKIKTNKIIFGLPESKSYIHIFELPKDLKREEIIKFVRSQAKETFPYPLEELCFDFQIRNNEVLLIAASKKIVADYLDVFKIGELQVVALEIESISLSRALGFQTKKPILIADIGARTTNLSVFDEDRLKLSFSVPIAGNRFSQSISEKLNIPSSAAESLKKEIGLFPEYENGKIFLILQKEIRGIIEEINRIKAYFQEKTKKNIEKIILVGASSTLPRLPEYLTENLGLPVEILDPWVKINIDILKKKEYFKEALEVNPILYSTVIGTALRGLSKNPQTAGINLLKGRD